MEVLQHSVVAAMAQARIDFIAEKTELFDENNCSNSLLGFILSHVSATLSLASAAVAAAASWLLLPLRLFLLLLLLLLLLCYFCCRLKPYCSQGDAPSPSSS